MNFYNEQLGHIPHPHDYKIERAISGNQLKTVKKLFNDKKTLNLNNEELLFLLTEAVIHSNFEIVHFLLQQENIQEAIRSKPHDDALLESLENIEDNFYIARLMVETYKSLGIPLPKDLAHNKNLQMVNRNIQNQFDNNTPKVEHSINDKAHALRDAIVGNCNIPESLLIPEIIFQYSDHVNQKCKNNFENIRKIQPVNAPDLLSSTKSLIAKFANEDFRETKIVSNKPIIFK